MPAFTSGNVKEERHNSKVHKTTIDETLFKKFLKEKENDILKIVKSRNCNVPPRHLMEKALDSDIQNLVLKYDKKSTAKLNAYLTILLEKVKK